MFVFLCHRGAIYIYILKYKTERVPLDYSDLKNLRSQGNASPKSRNFMAPPWGAGMHEHTRTHALESKAYRGTRRRIGRSETKGKVRSGYENGGFGSAFVCVVFMD